jgi:serine/threonine protein kinase
MYNSRVQSMPIDLRTFDPQPISVLIDGLLIGERLGQGGQKAVWRCLYRGQAYVLKILVADASSTERAKREIEVYRQCNSPFLPHVGPIHLAAAQVGPIADDVVLYYLEEQIEGIPLDLVRQPMDLQSVISMAVCIVDAIEELWKHGFVHRDIKPANIMQRTGSQHYVLLDAGLALDSAGPSLTQVGNVVGTPGFLSPDQLQLNKRDLDFRSDLFSLGICMYQCLTGRHPFWNSDVPTGDINHNTLHAACPQPQRWDSGLNPRLCDVTMRLLEKPRHLRYSKFEHLRDDLNAIVVI